MGKSAKLHKRLKKTKSKSSVASFAPAASITLEKAQTAQKRANLTAKAKTGSASSKGSRVLGGADYVDLMMGGRRKAKREAEKLSQD